LSGGNSTHPFLRAIVRERNLVMSIRFAKTRHIRTCLHVAAALTLVIFAPRPACAQPSDTWKGSIVPFYFWASSVSGDLTAANRTVPVFMSFDDAVDNLAAAFTFHGEVERGRVGFFGDLDYVKLSTASQFTLQTPIPRTISGDIDLDNIIFEAGGSYLLSDTAKFAVIGGLRTFTTGADVSFTVAGNETVTPVDANRTAVYGFAGFTYRPEFHERWRLISRADIGGGSAFTWSAVLGIEFEATHWLGLLAGYKGLGVGINSDNGENLGSYDATYYGPGFGLNLHWGK
jgi:hypothetical protein